MFGLSMCLRSNGKSCKRYQMTYFSRNKFALALSLSLVSGANAQESGLGLPSTAVLPDEPVTVEPGEATRDSRPINDGVTGAEIGAANAQAAGLVGAQLTGLPETMWQGTPASDAIAAVDSAEPSALWRVNALIRRALVSGAIPPEDADGLLARRAAALLRFGAAEEAASLAGVAGTAANPELRRVGAEADLIIGRGDAICKSAAILPQNLPKEDADGFWTSLRGFCLAKSGDPLAAVAIAAMREVGGVDPVDAELLEAMVDEGLAEFIPTPTGGNLTPLRIAILRALGRPVGELVETAPLNMLAGLFALESTPARSAVIAAERLEAAGSISTKELVELYVLHADTLGNDAVGARAQSVRDAIKSNDAASIGNFLLKTAEVQGAETFTRMARAFAPLAADLPTESASGLGAAGYAIRDSLLLDGRIQAAGRWSDAQGPRSLLDTADTNALFAIADSSWPGIWQRDWGDALRSRARDGDENARRALGALAGFEVGPAPTLENEGYLADAREGRIAEALFAASRAMRDENPASARTLDTMIRALRAANLDADARAIAIEAMLRARWQ